jgi:hypothetical protein
MFIQRVQSVGIPSCFYLKHDHLPSIISSEYSSNVQKFVSFFANLKYGVREKD